MGVNTPSSTTTTKEEKGRNHQILNVLKTLNLPKLQNGFGIHHHHPDVDANYGKHLKLILNSCKIHNRSLEIKNGKATQNDEIEHKMDDFDFYISQNGQYPSLCPMSYASPSPSPSITATPSASENGDGNQFDFEVEADDVTLNQQSIYGKKTKVCESIQ